MKNMWHISSRPFTVLITLVTLTAFAEFRTWAGKNGVSIQAELISVNDDTQSVSLHTSEGKNCQTAMSNLSEEDQKYIRVYEKNQKEKGLMKFRGQWLTPEQIKEIEIKDRELDYLERATQLIMSKAKSKVSYKVIQALPTGALCVVGKPATYSNNIIYAGEMFYLVGVTSKTVADDETYVDDLYWAGTFTYTTVKDIEKTVNSYSFDKNSAREAVRIKFGLYDPPISDTTSHTPNVETSEPILIDRKLKGFGSGFIITKNGYLLTNYHVVKNAKQVKVKTEKGILTASIVSQDPDNDIALLKVEGEFTSVVFADEKSAKLGQTVFTVGFPMPDLQGVSPKVTKGVISSLNGIQDDVRMYQIDAAVQPGNSGGPLADDHGTIVGIVVARLNDAYVAQSTGSMPQNINYAVKKSYILAFIDNTQDVSKSIEVDAENLQITFEEAVDKIRKATILVMVY